MAGLDHILRNRHRNRHCIHLALSASSSPRLQEPRKGSLLHDVDSPTLKLSGGNGSTTGPSQARSGFSTETGVDEALIPRKSLVGFPFVLPWLKRSLNAARLTLLCNRQRYVPWQFWIRKCRNVLATMAILTSSFTYLR